jgi:hypothetical protein
MGRQFKRVRPDLLVPLVDNKVRDVKVRGQFLVEQRGQLATRAVQRLRIRTVEGGKIVDADPRLLFRPGEGQSDQDLKQPLRAQPAIHWLVVKARQDDGVHFEIEANRQRRICRGGRLQLGESGGVHDVHDQPFLNSKWPEREDVAMRGILTPPSHFLSMAIRGLVQSLVRVR